MVFIPGFVLKPDRTCIADVGVNLEIKQSLKYLGYAVNYVAHNHITTAENVIRVDRKPFTDLSE